MATGFKPSALAINARQLELTTIADFLWSDYFTTAPFAAGIFLKAIKFTPGAAADRLVVRNGSLTGESITDLLSTTGDTIIDDALSNEKLKPCIDLSECTLSAGHKVIFVYSMNPVR